MQKCKKIIVWFAWHYSMQCSIQRAHPEKVNASCCNQSCSSDVTYANILSIIEVCSFNKRIVGCCLCTDALKNVVILIDCQLWIIFGSLLSTNCESIAMQTSLTVSCESSLEVFCQSTLNHVPCKPHRLSVVNHLWKSIVNEVWTNCHANLIDCQLWII